MTELSLDKKYPIDEVYSVEGLKKEGIELTEIHFADLILALRGDQRLLLKPIGDKYKVHIRYSINE